MASASLLFIHMIYINKNSFGASVHKDMSNLQVSDFPNPTLPFRPKYDYGVFGVLVSEQGPRVFSPPQRLNRLEAPCQRIVLQAYLN